MDWALGITVQSRQLACNFLSGHETHTGPLSLLSNRGSPDTQGAHKRSRVTSTFATWRHVDASEYLAIFGIEIPQSIANQHQLFEFSVDAKRFVVPCLVLLRTLSRPERLWLPDVFGSHALDRLCLLDSSVTPPELRIHEDCWPEFPKELFTPTRTAMLWMTSFPSAQRMIGSIHDYAIKER